MVNNRLQLKCRAHRWRFYSFHFPSLFSGFFCFVAFRGFFVSFFLLSFSQNNNRHTLDKRSVEPFPKNHTQQDMRMFYNWIDFSLSQISVWCMTNFNKCNNCPVWGQFSYNFHICLCNIKCPANWFIQIKTIKLM